MNREIKFRAWNKVNNSMLSSDDIAIILTLNGEVNKLNIMSSSETMLAHNRINEIDKYELMQFTGLHDKNGVEIYEGDIIDHFAMYGHVIYENGMFSMSNNANTQFCNCKQPLAYHDVNEMQVIGNIHQAPTAQ